MTDFEKLGLFYLGRRHDPAAGQNTGELVLYDSRDLLTHAVCVGMTGSGKTGLCLSVLEEAAIDGIPAIVVDPKGDLSNLLLTFPDLAPADFRPWINEDDARRKGMDEDAFAAAEATRWRDGLAAWGEDGARIRRLRDAVDMVIYTPGSSAGIPVSVLASFAAPPQDVIDDADLMRERVSTTATSLLGLIGIEADPIRSREHILLSLLFDTAWREGRPLDMAGLIASIQTPPVTRVGVMELEAFFPSNARFELASALNNLLAAPGFGAWMEGEPLDAKRLLYTQSGKPRIAIFSIAHLNDAERMFFVSLLLNETLGWMRTLSGTTSLRALVYMDEIFGYLPPTANPPSKLAMLTLLKQARAFGVGIVLATQNPVDLDYKALSNAGTWFIGRLQTDRDQARVLDALEGTSGAAKFDRTAASRTLTALASRMFLMHNVHEDAPIVLESRWALSYLRGPLTRAQIKTLMDPRRAEFAPPRQASPPPAPPQPAPASPVSRAAAPPQAASTAQAPASAVAADTGSAPPVLPPDVPQYFVPAKGPATYEPMLLGIADVQFTDTKTGVDETRVIAVATPIVDGAVAVDWAQAAASSLTAADLEREAPAGGRYAPLPGPAQKSKNYAAWTKSFVAWLGREQSLDVMRSDTYDVCSKPGESERDFRVRLMQAARESRDGDVARVRQKYAPKTAALQERLRRAQQDVQKQQEQASESKMQTAISFGTTLLNAVIGRKTLSAGTIGRATTAARGVGRSMKESQDVSRAEATVQAIQAQMQELETSLQADLAAIEASHNPAVEPLETVKLKPKRGGVHVQLVALVWTAAE